ncbi:hypothetical protein EVAR_11849_1 [Eumeta japonica]|uniref:Uncharacterized protein n=1 Tax=Eumeta variegata TaxID=151549 RepID=A0A4C1U8S2_EUMVA|nr:hypothetical protein EVAR_11849_1 [Eumeta japonica]
MTRPAVTRTTTSRAGFKIRTAKRNLGTRQWCSQHGCTRGGYRSATPKIQAAVTQSATILRILIGGKTDVRLRFFCCVYFWEYTIHDRAHSYVTPKWVAPGAGRPRRRPIATLLAGSRLTEQPASASQKILSICVCGMSLQQDSVCDQDMEILRYCYCIKHIPRNDNAPRTQYRRKDITDLKRSTYGSGSGQATLLVELVTAGEERFPNGDHGVHATAWASLLFHGSVADLGSRAIINYMWSRSTHRRNLEGGLFPAVNAQCPKRRNHASKALR